MMRKDVEQELIRICGCEDGTSLYTAKEKTDCVISHMLSASPEQLENYLKDYTMHYNVKPFPVINYEDSCFLSRVYRETEDDEMRRFIENIVAASMANTIICVAKKRVKNNVRGLYNTSEVLNDYIEDLILLVMGDVKMYDPEKNASYTTWLTSNVHQWIKDLEWQRYCDQIGYSIKTEPRVWDMVSAAMDVCNERHLDHTPAMIHRVIREIVGSKCVRIPGAKTIALAIDEITCHKHGTRSLDEYRNGDEKTPLYAYIADEHADNFYDSEAENDIEDEEATAEMQNLLNLPLASDPYNREVSKTEKMMIALKHAAMMYDTTKWFYDYLCGTILRENIKFKTSVELINIAAQAYRKTGCTETQCAKFKREVASVLSGMAANYEEIFSSYEEYDSENLFGDEVGVQAEDVSAVWANIISDAC